MYVISNSKYFLLKVNVVNDVLVSLDFLHYCLCTGISTHANILNSSWF